MAGGPNGVSCGKNDESLRQAIAQRHAFFQEIGFKHARVLNVEETQIDDHYTMAKVHWHMTFENQPGHLLDFKFFVTYFLFDSGAGPRVAFWISHEDEQKVMQEAGLIPSGKK